VPRYASVVREAFAQEAVLTMDPRADEHAPGAAITVALCGHWEHHPPCRTPHHTFADRDGSQVRVRILFAAEPERADSVRHDIDQTLASGRLTGPDGQSTRWELQSSQDSSVQVDEADHAQRLISS
jgi:hypothetical protein